MRRHSNARLPFLSLPIGCFARLSDMIHAQPFSCTPLHAVPVCLSFPIVSQPIPAIPINADTVRALPIRTCLLCHCNTFRTLPGQYTVRQSWPVHSCLPFHDFVFQAEPLPAYPVRSTGCPADPILFADTRLCFPCRYYARLALWPCQSLPRNCTPIEALPILSYPVCHFEPFLSPAFPASQFRAISILFIHRPSYPRLSYPCLGVAFRANPVCH